MESLLTFLIPLAMLATLVVLGFGVVQMIRRGDPRRSNKLMQYRVVFQGLALLLFAILMMVFKRRGLPHGPADAQLRLWRRCRRDLAWRRCAGGEARPARRGFRYGRRGECCDRPGAAFGGGGGRCHAGAHPERPL